MNNQRTSIYIGYVKNVVGSSWQWGTAETCGWNQKKRTTLQRASGLCEKNLVWFVLAVQNQTESIWDVEKTLAVRPAVKNRKNLGCEKSLVKNSTEEHMWTGSEEPTEDHLDLWKKSCAVRPGSEEPNERASGLWEKTLCGSQWRPRKNSLSLMRKKDCEKGSGFVLNGRTRHRSQRRTKERGVRGRNEKTKETEDGKPAWTYALCNNRIATK